jgi:hypothetical protein
MDGYIFSKSLDRSCWSNFVASSVAMFEPMRFFRMGIYEATCVCHCSKYHLKNMRVQNTSEEIRQNRGILDRVRLSWAHRAEACITNGARHFEQLL